MHAVNRGEEADRLVRRTPVGEDQNRDHHAEEAGVLPARSRSTVAGCGCGERVGAVRLPLRFLVPEEDRHHDADHHREEDGAYRSREPEVQAQHARGEDHGQHVDGGT